MISSQILQGAIDELRAITRIDLGLYDTEGRVVATTFQNEDISSDIIQQFAESVADSQVMQGCHFFKIFNEQVIEYVLISKVSNEDAGMIGKVAVSEIENLTVAYRERYDKNNFIQNLLLDNLLLVDMYNRAKKLHIDVEARRVVFMVETRQEKDNNARELLKTLFASRAKDFITAVDEKSIIIVRELKPEETYEDMEDVAQMMRDMLNSEAMSAVRISYGTIVDEIKQVSKSYKEAKMALDVGKIFYSERSIVAYSTLGIGRLIYQLPIPLCEMFMQEVFGDNIPDALDEETLMTINKFFENNLNVFDDALTFKIALMVVNYMKYMENQDY